MIYNAQPSSLGVKVLQSLAIDPFHAYELCVTATPGGWNAPVCPSLRRFGLRYRRWLRPSENFDLIPVFISIILSREQSNSSLHSFRIWTGINQTDPLELIEGLSISIKSFEVLRGYVVMADHAPATFVKVPATETLKIVGGNPSESDPCVKMMNMLEALMGGPMETMKIVPTHHAPTKWSLIRTDEVHPDLRHHSDNQFDFLAMAKFDQLFHHRMGDEEAETALTIVEKELLGDTRHKKILAKVVCAGNAPLADKRRNSWICSAITSAIAQHGAGVQELGYSQLGVNPYKQGYTWVVIPVRNTIFNVLSELRGAIDPKSGTLVLFRPWKGESFPIQHVFATGIHEDNDEVSFEVATTDYRDQMSGPLKKLNVKILEMIPARYGDKGSYTTRIKLGFEEGTLPFPVSLTELTRRFWTARRVKYSWPPKCRLCESEAHLAPDCPWRDFEMGNRKPNFHHCRRFNSPDWVEQLV